MRLLEPGALFEGALYRDLLATREVQFAAGMRFGVFKLVRELGRGGMGVVWLAERDDGEYRQQVAIKCIGDHKSAPGAELFRHERQILAELKHPNIARLLDGGHRDDGVPWFAMEFIDGVAIDQHARRAQLDLHARLRLFIDVIGAVSVAHARLVIHRDLKPGNVLVDADGTAKLLDFGIAALVEDSDAARAYSPAWASPEQLAGERVGTASDQYQLGLLLDAVLQAADARKDAIESVRAQRRPTDSDADRWIAMPRHRRLELQAVLARACATDPAARYQSVADLGHELERMLEQRPVAALGRRGAYPLACALRRRPGVFLASALGILLIAVLVGGFTWRLARERDISRAEAVRAEAIKDFLVGLFRDGDPTRGSDPDLSARDLIQAGALRVEADPSLPTDARRELMQLLADIQLRLGDGEHAGALIERLDPEALDAATLAEFQGRLAFLQGRPNDALRYLTDALAQGDTPERQLLLARVESEAGAGTQSAARLEVLLRDEAQLPDAFAASAWIALGVLHWRDAKPVDALADYERALGRAAHSRVPISPVAAHINKGLALNDLGRFDEALAEYDRAEAALARFPNLKHQGLILQNRGMSLLRRGDAADAQTVWKTLLGTVDDGVNPGIEASTVHNLAAAADALGDPVASIGYSLRAQALRTALGDAPSALSSRINVIAKLYSVGLAQAGVDLAKVAEADAARLARPDLAARARLAGRNSRCVLEPDHCIALLEASAQEFADQHNQVKWLETLEKIASFALDHADRPTLQRSAERFAAAIGTHADADSRGRLALLQALASGDPALLRTHTEHSDWARRALVLVALKGGDASTAKREFAAMTVESSERYWLLAEAVAAAAADAAAVENARAEREKLREAVRTLLGQNP